MPDRDKTFLDRLVERLDAIDSSSIQAYILHLAREKGFLETIFNAVREGILVINRELKIRYHNHAAKELLGLPDDLSRLRVSNFLHDIDWHRILRGDEVEWSRLSRQEIEVFYPRHRFLTFYLVPHEEDSSLATILLHDITESRERSKQEVESETLQVVSQLAAGVAHEIGNPLNSLYLHLQLLQQQFEEGDFDVDDTLEMIKTSRSEVERLDGIISQFLRAVRPSKPNMQPTDVKDVIISSLKFMQQEIESRGVDVKCTFPDFLPLISADAQQLKQAFYNIIKNATQAMPDGGELEISCSYDDDFLRVEFTDSGVGISREEFHRVFDPYETSKQTGTGLGLMIIERIFREHGAELMLESDEGKGASFSIRFPRHGKRIRVLAAPPENEEIMNDILPEE